MGSGCCRETGAWPSTPTRAAESGRCLARREGAALGWSWPATRAPRAKGPSLNESEFWFLDVAVESKYPLFAVAGPNVEMELNRRGHGLNTDQVIEVLAELHRRAWIEFHEQEGGPCGFDPEFWRVALKTKADGSRASPYYGLTPAGGAAWESVTSPDWSRFLDGTWMCPDEGTLGVAGADRARVEAELHWPESPMAFSDEIISDERWEILEPWQATYWKVLPLGHRVTAKYESVPRPPRRCSQYRELLKASREPAQRREEFRRWYRNPFAR